MSSIPITAGRSISGATGGQPLSDDKPLVLLVHGAGMDRSVWSLQTRWLAHHGCSALALDLPGHGASTEPMRMTIDGYADWTAQVVTDLDRPVHLVGHSMGTFIGLETALKADLASLTLIGTAEGMPVHPTLLKAAEANDPLAAQLMSGWAFATNSRTGSHPSPGSSMVGSTQAMIGQSAPGVLHADLSMCAAYEGAVAAAAALPCPTQFILGQADKMTPVRSAKPLTDAAAGPNTRTTVLSGIGHMIQIEAPNPTRELIAEFATANPFAHV